MSVGDGAACWTRHKRVKNVGQGCVCVDCVLLHRESPRARDTCRRYTRIGLNNLYIKTLSRSSRCIHWVLRGKCKWVRTNRDAIERSCWDNYDWRTLCVIYRHCCSGLCLKIRWEAGCLSNRENHVPASWYCWVKTVGRYGDGARWITFCNYLRARDRWRKTNSCNLVAIKKQLKNIDRNRRADIIKRDLKSKLYVSCRNQVRRVCHLQVPILIGANRLWCESSDDVICACVIMSDESLLWLQDNAAESSRI